MTNGQRLGFILAWIAVFAFGVVAAVWLALHGGAVEI